MKSTRICDNCGQEKDITKFEKYANNRRYTCTRCRNIKKGHIKKIKAEDNFSQTTIIIPINNDNMTIH